MTAAHGRSWAAAVLAVSAAATLWAADPVAQWNLTAADAQERIVRQVTNGRGPDGAVMTVFKKLPAAARVTLTQESMAWAKTYTSSAAFRTAYSQARDASKPAAPTFTGTVDDEVKAQLAKQEADMKQGMQGLSALPADQRRQIETQINQTIQQLKSPEMQKMMRDGLAMQRASEQENYQRDLAKWQTDYPENPQVAVARRLQRFLETSGTVDFAAQTTAKDGKMVFANPQYESKPGDWKMHYRAGREAVTAARTVAQTWLKEVETAR